MKHKRLLEALIAGTVLFGFCSCRTIDDEKIKDINEKEDRDYSLYKKRDFYRDSRLSSRSN